MSAFFSVLTGPSMVALAGTRAQYADAQYASAQDPIARDIGWKKHKGCR